MATFKPRPVPARRLNTDLQNFVYMGDIDAATERRLAARVAEIARRERETRAIEPGHGQLAASHPARLSPRLLFDWLRDRVIGLI